MRPIKVEFQSFGPYRGYECVDFEAVSDKGIFLICGNTGMGKTMILDAMTFALYGKSSGNARNDFEAMRCTGADFKDTTFVKFEFENNGEYYIFERRLERKTKNLSQQYNLMKRDGDGVYRPVFENAKATLLDNKAEEIIGLNYDQFRQVIVLPQGQFEKFLTSESKEKENILSNIFDEKKWSAIAERLYGEVSSRKQELKTKKDRIMNILEEEQCDSVEGLGNLVKLKEKELGALEEDYRKTDYAKQSKEVQDKLTLADRFEDLRGAVKRVADFDAYANERKDWGKRTEAALRAEKVRVLLEKADTAKAGVEQRRLAEETLKASVEEKKKSAEESFASYNSHVAGEADIEEKKKLKIQYENKRTDYENVKKAEKELEDRKNKGNAAIAEEKEAQAKVNKCEAAMKSLREEYEKLKHEHDRLFDIYIAGIAGELAEDLKEGAPCPVCGSTSHPHKAKRAEGSVTRNEVDSAKTAAEGKYKAIQEAVDGREKAQKQYDAKKDEVAALRIDYDAAKLNLETMKSNLVQGIDSSEGLDREIAKLGREIKRYEDEKARLDNLYKMGKESYLSEKAKVEPAMHEREKAEQEYKDALSKVKESLEENKFTTENEARAALLSEWEKDEYSKKISEYDTNLKASKQNVEDLKKRLEGIEEPDKASCEAAAEAIREAQRVYDEKKGSLGNEIKRLKDKFKSLSKDSEGLDEKLREAEQDYVVAKNLRGDTGVGLQRYVLGIMFSSVIAAANVMLKQVHGGRYHLFRSDDKGQGNKRGLELKVLDKYSEEHEGRFVNTLSGGEKFLVSLALSIGMSTIAQKSGIKIEALFIDEGFGSLDEASIEDAMTVLESIRKSNGIVGIISHVGLLQDRIPTKLKVVQVDNGSHIVQSIG